MKNLTTRKWLCSTVLALGCIATTLGATDDARIKIFPAQTKEDIELKMKNNKWASETLRQAHQSVDKYVDIHQGDSTWIISRLQMYWKNHYTTPYINGGHYSRAEGSAPVPTVRFTGGRDWATNWATPKLEDIVPYMDYRDDQIYLQNNKKEGKPWEWVDNSQTAHQIESINAGIVQRAMNSAFIYWLTGDEKYAKFAYDIMMVYVDGMYYREAPIAEIDARNAKIVGLTSFEVIHEKVINYLPLCYDFLFDYTLSQGADLEKIHKVFQKFADQIIINGVATNNWNIFQARFVTYLALLLNDDSTYENGKGKQYYIDFLLNKSVERQKALREVCDIYDQNTGMWNESPGYSTSTTKDLIEVLLLIDGLENKDILEEFPIVEKAAISSFEYLLPNKRTVAFGDNGYAKLDYSMYETLLALYTKYGKTEKAEMLSSVLAQEIKDGLYNREGGSSLYKLFNYVESIDLAAAADQDLFSTNFYAPNVNLFIQRNGMDKEEGLMLVNAGTGFNHCHSNGVNMELYGKGYPLGIDKARGSSYWVADHSEYYSKTISHNTVLIDGVSVNSSKRITPGEESLSHKMLSCFPEQNLKDAKEPYILSYVDNSYLEDGTMSDQRRVNGIVRTSPTTGYYVDIFRSRKQNGTDKMHEYIYHNAGQKLNLFGEDGAALKLTPSTDLTPEGGKIKGYNYLTDKMEVDYDKDFKGTFELNFSDRRDDVRMDLWMKGEEDRKLFSVMTPRALKGLDDSFSKELNNATIPAIFVRQNGEAWSRPFVAIYEPYTTQEGSSIESVNYIECADSEFVGVEVNSKSGNREYIFNHTNPQNTISLKEIDAEVQAIYGVIAESQEGLSYLFLGDGKVVSRGDYAISAVQGNATVLVEWTECGFKVKSDAEFSLQLPKKGAPKSLSYTDCKGATQTITGKSAKGVVKFTIPALNNIVLK